MFLTPLQQLAFEVHFLKGHLVQVYVMAQDSICEEVLTVSITSVNIYGADECFKRISRQVAVVRLIMVVALD